MVKNTKFGKDLDFIFVQKDFFILNFNLKAVIDKVSILHEFAPNFTFTQNQFFTSIIGTFFMQTAFIL